MTRWALASVALLLACSPPTDGDGNGSPADPVERSSDVPGDEPAQKPSRKPAAPKKKESLEAGGSYYQYVDESGRVRFAASLDEVPERQRSTAGHISVTPPQRSTRRPSRAETEEARPNERTTNANVVLYTTESCGYCRKAAAYLDRIGQDYVNKDVESDEDARDEYLQLTNGRPGVPVIVVGDQWMQGWSQQQLDKMLADSR